MDTPCIPEDLKLRREAMREAFSKASYVKKSTESCRKAASFSTGIQKYAYMMNSTLISIHARTMSLKPMIGNGSKECGLV